MSNGWIGFDLDGTLAYYDGWKGPENIGPPIAPMLALLKDYLARGVECRIMTARACNPAHIPHVEQWCIRWIGQRLRVTNQKDYEMWLLYDDRAIAVEENTGHVKGYRALDVDDNHWISIDE